MDPDSLKSRIELIARDRKMEVAERIRKILDLGRETVSDDPHERTIREAIVFTSLIEMLKGEEERSNHLADLLDLLASLASVYVEQGNFKAVKPLAEEVLDMMRHGEVSWKMIEQPVGEMIDTLGSTVYNHLLLEMLILYIDSAAKAGRLKKDLKGRVRKMLKLHLLLKDGCWCSYLLRKDLQPNIAKLMTSEELLKIIISPEIDSLKKDPVEYTREWEDIFYDVEEELDRKFAGTPRYTGFCFGYWRAKHELLKEKHGIDWRNPARMNPRIKFD